MNKEDKSYLLQLLQQLHELGVSKQPDYMKQYLYKLITHSTAIEGSTLTEQEAQLLFDAGLTPARRTWMELMMNLDLKNAYDDGMQWIMHHEAITVEGLIMLASKVMARTGGEYHSLGGDFSAAKGELRKLNVTAGLGGQSYLSYLKVPSRLTTFCEQLNKRRKVVDPEDVAAVYDLSFWAHYELVTIHPWVDGNGRTSRLLMNLLQIEQGLLPSQVLKGDEAEYIQALRDSRTEEDCNIFLDCMTHLHCRHLKWGIDRYVRSAGSLIVD